MLRWWFCCDGDFVALVISLWFHCAADVVVALVLSLRWCFRCAGDVVVLVISLRWWFCCARDFFSADFVCAGDFVCASDLFGLVISLRWWCCCAGDFVALVILLRWWCCLRWRLCLSRWFCCAVDSCCVGDCVVLGWWFCCAGVFVVSFCVFEGGVSAKSVFEECLAGVSANSVSLRVFQGVFSGMSSPYCLQAMFSMRVLPSVSSQDCFSKSVLHMSWQAGLGRSLLLSSLLLLVVSFFLFYVAFRFVGHCTLLATMYEKKTFSYCRGFTRSPRTWIHSGSWLPSCFLGGIPTIQSHPSCPSRPWGGSCGWPHRTCGVWSRGSCGWRWPKCRGAQRRGNCLHS